MNVQLLRTLIALQSVPAPDPQPESLQPKPPWEGDDGRDDPKPTPPPKWAWDRAAYADPFPAPNLYAPVKGRVVSQAKGPNRAQRRARR